MPRDSLISPLEAALKNAPSFGMPETFTRKAEGQQNPTFTPGNVPYQADFERAAVQYNVPANILMALAQQESGFKPTALGQPTQYGRAKGLMQYIDSTAAGMGINPYDPAQSIDAAARQLKQRLDQGYTMQEAVQAHFGGDNRKQWGPKTRQYGVEVLGKAEKFLGGAGAAAPAQASQVETAGQQPAGAMGDYPPAQSAMENMNQTALRDEALRLKSIQDDLNKDEPDRYRPLTAEEMQQWQQKQDADKPIPLDTSPAAKPVQVGGTPGGDSSAWNSVVDGAKDAGVLLMSGWNMAAKDLTELTGRIPVIGKPIVDAMNRFDTWRLGKSTEETFKEWDQNADKAFSPAMAEARKKSWVVEPGDELAPGKKAESYNFGPAWSDPRAYASGLLESLPEMAVTMGGTGRLAQFAYKRALAKGASKEVAAKAAARTATVAGGIIEGGFGGAAAARETRDQILKMSPEQLKDSDALSSLMESGKTFEEARKEVADSASSKAFVLAGVGTGIFGGMGDRAMAKIITGNSGRLKSALTGFIGEGLMEEVPQSALQQMGQNAALQEADPNTPLMKGVANQAAGGLAVGGLMGAGMGFAAPRAGEVAQQSPADAAPVPDGQPAVEPVQAAEPVQAVPSTSRDETGLSENAGPLERAVKGTAAQPTEANGNLWAGEVGRAVSMQAKGDPDTAMDVTIERYDRDGSVTVRDEGGTPYTVSPDDVDITAMAPASQQTTDQMMQDAGTSQEVKEERQQAEETAQAEADSKAEKAQQQAIKEAQQAEEKPATSRIKPAERPQERPRDRQLTEYSEDELRDRMRYLATQAKQGGWTGQLTKARQQVEKVLNAKVAERENGQLDAAAKPDQSESAELATAAQADQPATVSVSDEGAGTDRPATAPAGRSDSVVGAGSRLDADTPAAVSGTDTDATLNGADGKPKWFTSGEKAQAHLDKKKLTGYRVVETKPRRFEMHRDVISADNAVERASLSDNTPKTAADAAPKTAQSSKSVKPNPRVNRAKKVVGDIGATVSPSGDVGYLKAGGQYKIDQIDKSGTIHVTNAETGSSTSITVSEMEAARSRQVEWKKQADAVAETTTDEPKAQRGEWQEFDNDSGTLNIPRADMPQIKAEHRGAMTNFLNARGIAHQEATVPATGLKPSQAEFSPERVARAAERTEGDRSILVSSDGYVLDGHHQWLAARDAGEDVKTIRFDAPISELIAAAKEFPSSTLDDASAAMKPAKSESKAPETVSEAAKTEPETANSAYGADNKLVSADRAAELRQRLKAKFSQLNSGIDPEILAIGTELAVFHIEAGVRKFSAFAKAIAKDLDQPLDKVRPYLRSWYNGARDMMEDSGVSIDGMDNAETVRTELSKLDQAPVKQPDLATPAPVAQNQPAVKQTAPAGQARETSALDDMVSAFDSEVTPNATGQRTRLERNSQNEDGAVSVNESPDVDGSGRNDPGATGAGRTAGAERGNRSGNQRVSDDSATAGRARSDQPVYQPNGEFEPAPGAARSVERSGGDSDSAAGLQSGSGRTAAVAKNAHAAGASDLSQRLAAQKAANKRAAKPKFGDRASIDEALPLLLEKQRDDVEAVEARHAVASGILITNGTGTGKTASGLGVAKRHFDAGRTNIAVVVPTDKIANDWVRFAGSIGMPLKQLEGIADNGGTGPVITTYANFGQNDALAKRDWDLIIPDESHYLSSNAAGESTAALEKLRALTGHHEGFQPFMKARYAEQFQARSDAYDAFNLLKESDAGYAAAKAAAEKADKAWNDLLNRERGPWEQRWSEQKDLPKVTFLSATPFAYVKSTDYAEGYLFHHAEPGERFTNRTDGGYNSGDSRDNFYMQHFGYRMRYNKLTQPEAGVNSELMEQNFNQHLKDTGALIGRSLDVPFDYDRKFQLIEDAAGKKLDDALRYLNDHNEGQYRPVYDAVMKSFDYQSRMFLLESMKARAAVPVIKEHLALGRKVVVFHDYNKGGGFSPFAEALNYLSKTQGGAELLPVARELFNRPMFRINFSGLDSALNTLTAAYPDALLFNGTVPKGTRRKNADLFNDDNSGKNLIIAQSDAAREGVSLHDTTGKFQRIEINLGMPTKPVAAIQIEGRVYRTGQASDAIFRYLTTGTGWEASAFASKIAERASTAENLALGADARGLKQAFVDGYNAADALSASREDGKGGKELDRMMSAGKSLSPFDKAKTFYFAQQKNTKSRANREGDDYYATPEPVGLKMVEWAGVKPGDKVLEPSAGHGAIARFIPPQTDVTMIEPSYDLSQRASLSNTGARVVNGKFEDFSRTNKYDAIVMNPPYGHGGKTAVEHMSKAAQHLREGGRMVALVPRGGLTDRRLLEFAEVAEKNKLQLVARVMMPGSTFERAGTKVATQVLVYEKNSNADAVEPQVREVDLSNAENVAELFDRIENVDLPARRELTSNEILRNSMDQVGGTLDSWQRVTATQRDATPEQLDSLKRIRDSNGQAESYDQFAELARRIEMQNLTATSNPQRVLASLRAAEVSGEYNKQGMQLAQWLIRQYPHLANTLSVDLRKGSEDLPAGNYNVASRVVSLYSNYTNDSGQRVAGTDAITAAHEIMHHLERMLPRDVQEAITDRWFEAMKARMAEYNAAGQRTQSDLLADLIAGMYGDRAGLERARQAMMNGTLPGSDYQFASPSEYWAENGARIIAERKAEAERLATRNWVDKAVDSMRAIIAKIRSLLGRKSDTRSEIDAAIDSILAGDGQYIENAQILNRVGDDLYGLSERFNGDYQVADIPQLKSGLKTDPQIPTPEQDNAKVRSWFNSFKNLTTDKTTDAMSKGLAVIPMRPLIQELGRNMPSAAEYLRLKQSMDAMRNKWHAKTDEVAQRWLEFRKADKDRNQVLMDIMHEATITGVDPTMPFGQFLDQYMANVEAQVKLKDPTADVTIGPERTAELRDIHDSLVKRLKDIGEEGRQVFNDVRNAYGDLSTAYEKVLMANMEKAINVRIKQAERAHRQALRQIKDEGLEGDALKKAVEEADRKLKVAKTKTAWNRKARITQLRTQFETQRLAGVYFPLARFGELFVAVRDKKTRKMLSFSRFEKASEQREFADLMAQDKGQEVQVGVLDKADDLLKAVDANFVADIEDILAELPNAEKIKDEVWQRYLESLPDYSVRTNRIHRTKREGFNRDALRAFGSQMFHGSHQLARLAHTFDMQEALDATHEESTKTADPVRDGKVYNEMVKRHEFVMNPTGGALVQKISQAAFIYALAASPKAALVNLTQTAIIGVPVLGAFDGSSTGLLRASNQLTRALGDFTRGKGKAEDSKRLSKEERQAMQAAYDTGLIDKSQAHDLAGIGESGVEYSPARTKVMAALAWGFHQTERLNREVTFLAAYRMAKAKGFAHQAAILKAGDLTWKTHFDYQNTSRPRLMHNDTMKALLVFRNFSINMLYRLFRDVHQSFAGDTPEVKREARIQLAGTTGMMMLSAGITGTWGYGIMMVLAGMFMDDDKDPEAELKKNMVEALGPMMAGIILDGAPGYATGTALSDSIGMKDLWFRSPSTQLEGKAEAEYWKSQLLGAAPSMADNIIRGFQMLTDGQTYRGIETILPKALKDPMKAYRYATEGAENKRGDKIVDEVGGFDVLRQALGFTPAKLAEQYQINNAGYSLQQTIMNKRKQLMDSYWKAEQAGDEAALDKLDKQIDEFSDKYPEQEITPKSLMQSAKTRERNAEGAEGGMRYNSKLRDRILEDRAPSIYK